MAVLTEAAIVLCGLKFTGTNASEEIGTCTESYSLSRLDASKQTWNATNFAGIDVAVAVGEYWQPS